MRQLLRTLRTTLVLRAIELLGPRRRRIVGWRALVGADVRDVTFVRDGLVWTVSPEDGPVGFGLFTDGAYHRDEMQALLAWLARSGVLAPPRDVIVDAGAHVGSTCIPLVRATGGRALAIEPVAESFRRLETNVVANGLADRITCVRAAVTRVPGRVTMCAETRQSGSSFVRRERADAPGRELHDGPTPEEVDGRPLDALLAEAGVRPDEVALVWADVQGSEADVMESGAVLWALGVPLWAEIEPHALARQGSLERFAELAAQHFDCFVESRILVRDGAGARPAPIAELPALMRGISPRQVNTDVLLLPPRDSLLARTETHPA